MYTSEVIFVEMQPFKREATTKIEFAVFALVFEWNKANKNNKV